MYKLITIPLILTSISSAETDSFDMGLSGEFAKDYCTFSTVDSLEFNIAMKTPTATNPNPDNSRWSRAYYSRIEGTCSAGTYDVFIGQIDPLIVQYPDKNQEFRLNAKIEGQWLSAGDMLDRAYISNTSEAYIKNVQFDPSAGNFFQFNLNGYIRPLNGIFTDMADTYTHSGTVVITIDSK